MQILEIYYNLRGDREPKIEGDTVMLKYNWQTLTFSYDLITGRAAYLLACSDSDSECYVKGLGDRKLPAGRQPHPFGIHLILLFKAVLNSNEKLKDVFRGLILCEDRSIFQRSKVTFESGDATKRRLQELHSFSRELFMCDNTNKRYIASVESLMRDLERLHKAIRSTAQALPIDEYDHQRMVDGFHYLRSFCFDRERRINTRLQSAKSHSSGKITSQR